MEKDEFILYGLEAKTSEEVIREMVKPLLKAKIVNENYADEVVEREKEYPTGLPTMKIGVAIPHTESSNINSNKCVAAFLKQPIKWRSMEDMSQEIDVQVVLLLAANDPNDHLQFLVRLSTVLSDEETLTRLSNVNSRDSFCEVLEYLLKEEN